MTLFKVVKIIDGDTLEVAGWRWNEYSGKIVKIVGYKVTPDTSEYAKMKLEILLKDKRVELKFRMSAEKREGGDILTCSVWLNDINVANYFPELSGEPFLYHMRKI